MNLNPDCSNIFLNINNFDVCQLDKFELLNKNKFNSIKKLILVVFVSTGNI